MFGRGVLGVEYANTYKGVVMCEGVLKVLGTIIVGVLLAFLISG